MKEALLQYIWKNALYATTEYIADTGDTVVVQHPGKQSADQGPDFTEGRITINGTLWVGNVEIHTRASDWYLHKHNENPGYNNVVLHVVQENDRICVSERGRQIPAIRLNYDQTLEQRYHNLMLSELKIPCLPDIGSMEDSRISFWLQSLAVARLERKTAEIAALLQTVGGSWEEAFYIQLARSFGLKVNALPFELLAGSLPLKILLKEPENIVRTEALLFGQAGLLPKDSVDEYSGKLLAEYQYQRKIYGLKPIDGHLWKFLRLRPFSFPTVRLAQLAGLLAHGHRLFSQAMELKTREDFVHFFSCEVSTYWKNHYKFGTGSGTKTKRMGLSTVYLLAINTVIPFMFYYGQIKNRTELSERALALLEQLPAEKNAISALWEQVGIRARHALESQALLQLHAAYCQPRRCLQCAIGHHVINRCRP